MGQSKIKYTEDYIRKNADTLDWEEASLSVNPMEVSKELLWDYEGEWEWHYLLLRVNFNVSFFKELLAKKKLKKDDIIYYIYYNKFITEEIFEYLCSEYKSEDLFPPLCTNNKIFSFSKEFINKNIDKLSWSNISFLEIPEEFEKEYHEKLKQHQVFFEQILP